MGNGATDTIAPRRLTKQEAIEHWEQLNEDLPHPAAVMRRIPASHTGSTYTQDGIRVTGTKELIDSFLVLMRPLLDRENDNERLALNYAESKDKDTRIPTGFWTLYLQVWARS